MKIKTKLFALVSALSLGTIIIAGVGIGTVRTYNAAVDDVRDAAIHALYAERLNRLVTHVVMESRGIYASPDIKEAQKFGNGVLLALTEIDTLLRQWKLYIPAEDNALFATLEKDAADFKTYRTETARLGTEVSPAAANAQGNTESNRANRKAVQVNVDALTDRGRKTMDAV